MKKISSRSYFVGFRTHLIPVIVWLGTLACVVAMFSHRSMRFQVVGISQGNVQEIASTCTGRLTSLAVDLFDEVKRGQTLVVIDAVLDNERPGPELEAQLATVQARIDHLVADANSIRDAYVAQIEGRRTGWNSDSRAFATNVAEARLRELELAATIKTDELTVRSMELEIKRFLLSGRLDANDVGYLELEQLKIDRDVIVKRIDENGRILEQSRADLEEAKARQEEFVRNREPHIGPSDVAAQTVIDKARNVLEREMDELMVQLESLGLRETLELTSPFDGVVSLIYRGPGETVVAGQPILTIAESKPTEIVAYTTERQAAGVKQWMEVELVKRADPAQVATSQVVSVGPTIEQVPQRLWRNPNIPEWGRPILVKIPAAMKLAPGEAVGIRGL